jgi:hypothetical protein
MKNEKSAGLSIFWKVHALRLRGDGLNLHLAAARRIGERNRFRGLIIPTKPGDNLARTCATVEK